MLQQDRLGRTFEDVTILQLLSIRTMSKTLLQRLEGFRAQRILAGWTGDGGAFGSGGGGGVGGSCKRFPWCGASEYGGRGQ